MRNLIVSALMPVLTVVLVSGCTTELSETGGFVNGANNIGNTTNTETGDIKTAASLCEGISCSNSERTCPDGFAAACENSCMQETGKCTSCEPSCAGHDAAEEQPQELEPNECDKECSTCEALNEEACECNPVAPCAGNGLCEEGEYPSSDCPDCSDSNPCTDDDYDYEAQQCTHSAMSSCCGDNVCESGETFDSCPADCPAETGNIIFTEVYYDTRGTDSSEEWIEVYNPTQNEVNMSYWTITDNTGTWTFPFGVSIESGKYLAIARMDGSGFENLYDCIPEVVTLTLSLSNSGDFLILKDRDENEIDFVAWETGGGDYPNWLIEASTDKSTQRNGFTDTDSPDDWLSDQTPDPSSC